MRWLDDFWPRRRGGGGLLLPLPPVFMPTQLYPIPNCRIINSINSSLSFGLGKSLTVPVDWSGVAAICSIRRFGGGGMCAFFFVIFFMVPWFRCCPVCYYREGPKMQLIFGAFLLLLLLLLLACVHTFLSVFFVIGFRNASKGYIFLGTRKVWRLVLCGRCFDDCSKFIRTVVLFVFCLARFFFCRVEC